MPRPFFRAAAITLLFAAGACSPPQEKAKPALWAVRDADTTLFVLGSVHQLPANIDWDDGAVGDAIDSADALYLELSPQESGHVPGVFTGLAVTADPRTPVERLGPELGPRLTAIAEEDKIAPGDISEYDDWAIAVMIGRAQAERAGLSPAYGVETVLSARFMNAGKPVRGLESAESQLMLFENLPATAQHAMLKGAVRDWDKGPDQIAAMLTAWKKGDIDALHADMADDLDAVEGLAEPLINARNRRWADWAARRMASPGTALVAVGTGHLTGEKSLLTLIAQRGWKVERLQ